MASSSAPASTTLAQALTDATAEVNAAASQFFDLENRVALREAGAVQASGLTPNPADPTELAQANALGTHFVAMPGGAVNALRVALAGGVSWPALLNDMTFMLPTLGANTDVVTVAVSGFTAVPAPVSGSGLPAGVLQLLTRSGAPLKAGDLTGANVRVRADGAGALRVVDTLPSEAAQNASGAVTTFVSNLLITGGRRKQWSTPGTYSWTVPTGVTSIRVRAWSGGGGGGAGSSSSSGGSGGGGGMYGEDTYAVTPGQVLTITVGAGGTAGPASTSAPGAGGVGGTTSVGSLMTLTGGQGGQAGNGGTATQLSNTGTASGATIVVPGYFGGLSFTISGVVQGGSGGAAFATSQPPVNVAPSGGNPGMFPGGGAGGAAGYAAGGVGGAGMVAIEF